MIYIPINMVNEVIIYMTQYYLFCHRLVATSCVYKRFKTLEVETLQVMKEKCFLFFFFYTLERSKN